MNNKLLVLLSVCSLAQASQRGTIANPGFFDDVPYKSPASAEVASQKRFEDIKFLSVEDTVLQELIKNSDLLKVAQFELQEKNRDIAHLRIENEIFKSVNPYNPKVLVGLTAVGTFVVTSLLYRWRR